MITIYTYNGNVVKDITTGKWLTKKENPGPQFDEVTVGTQTWMAKNLDIHEGFSGVYSANVGNFGTQYYYTPWVAEQISNTIEGWHLPTEADCQTLINFLNGDSTKIRSTSGWNINGTDDYGFNALPLGYYRYANNQVQRSGSLAVFAIPYTSDPQLLYVADNDGGTGDDTILVDGYMPNNAYSVRLIKDT